MAKKNCFGRDKSCLMAKEICSEETNKENMGNYARYKLLSHQRASKANEMPNFIPISKKRDKG